MHVCSLSHRHTSYHNGYASDHESLPNVFVPWVWFGFVHYPDVHGYKLPNVRLCSLSYHKATYHDDNPTDDHSMYDVYVPSLWT